MTIEEIQAGAKAQVKDIEDKIEELKSQKLNAITEAQKAIKRQWDIDSKIKNGARVVVGPKMFEVCLRFSRYRPLKLEVEVIELSASKTLKENYSCTTSLSGFLGSYPDVEFVNPENSKYNTLSPLDVSKLKSWQGFSIGQEVAWSEFGGFRSVTRTGEIVKFTKTGKATVLLSWGEKSTLDINKLSPVNE